MTAQRAAGRYPEQIVSQIPEVLSGVLEDLLNRRLPELSAMENTLPDALRTELRCFKEGQHETAIQSAASMIRDYNEPAAYLMLAAGYMLVEEPDCALTILDILMHSDPGYAEAYLLKGVYLRRLRRRFESRQHLQTAITIKPELSWGWRILMEMAVEDGRPLEAAQLRNEAQQISGFAELQIPEVQPENRPHGRHRRPTSRKHAVLIHHEPAMGSPPDAGTFKRRRPLRGSPRSVRLRRKACGYISR
jgi:tetratricopeptide (TPR) repeat protein